MRNLECASNTKLSKQENQMHVLLTAGYHSLGALESFLLFSKVGTLRTNIIILL